MFRRRRREDADQAAPGNPEAADAAGDAGDGWADSDEIGDWDDGSAPGGVAGAAGGPWDADDAYPERDRADFGSLLVPIAPNQQIELATDGQRFIWVTVKNGASELRVHAFAAPRSAGLWQEVRQEIAEELSSAGTAAEETEGPFGTEVFAHVAGGAGQPRRGHHPGPVHRHRRPAVAAARPDHRGRGDRRRALRAVRGPAQRHRGRARGPSDAAAGHAGTAAAARGSAGARAAAGGRAAGGRRCGASRRRRTGSAPPISTRSSAARSSPKRADPPPRPAPPRPDLAWT